MNDKVREKCSKCVHCKSLYYTTDEEEIEEIRKIMIGKKRKLYCDMTKKLLDKPEKLVEYVREINPEDVSYEEWNEGFLKEPETEKEKQEIELYCMVDILEPAELEEFGEADVKDCTEYTEA